MLKGLCRALNRASVDGNHQICAFGGFDHSLYVRPDSGQAEESCYFLFCQLYSGIVGYLSYI